MTALVLLLAASLPAAEPALPPVVIGDGFRFPEPAEASAAVMLAERHIDYLLIRHKHEPTRAWLWEPWLYEAHQCLRPWLLLRSFHRHSDWAVADRIADLTHLREAIGPEAFYQGAMPCPVPWWRFQEIDHPPPPRPPIGPMPEPPPGWRKAG